MPNTLVVTGVAQQLLFGTSGDTELTFSLILVNPQTRAQFLLPVSQENLEQVLELAEEDGGKEAHDKQDRYEGYTEGTTVPARPSAGTQI